jgi:Zn-dependent M28 family amino/carboxypeptidase
MMNLDLCHELSPVLKEFEAAIFCGRYGSDSVRYRQRAFGCIGTSLVGCVCCAILYRYKLTEKTYWASSTIGVFMDIRAASFGLLLGVVSLIANAQTSGSMTSSKSLQEIRDHALASDWAYQRLADLTDLIGPRLSGSPQAQAAVEQVAAALRADGFKVTLQPVRVSHWVRGVEQAELIEYAQQPKGITQQLHLTTLGGSVATPPKGIVAPVLVVTSFNELTARAAEARGRIVVFNVPFDQELADNGQAGTAYGQAGAYRRGGASAAAKVGGIAALVRSVGGANYRLPHTGQMNYEAGVAKIPTAAVSAEDAMLLARLAKRGAVTMKLVLTPQMLPEVDSFNVIADYVGSEKPDEIVLISGHLDSWDLATGAIDDGAGVAAAMGVAHTIKELNLHPKRTLRVVAWMNEENGGAGGRTYFNAFKEGPIKHVAVIESDPGAGKPLGIDGFADPKSMTQLQGLRETFTPMGATALRQSDSPVGSDIAQWQQIGVPGFEPMFDTRHYFDYHHTAADTLDKVDPRNLQRMVAVMGVLAFYLADAPEMLEGVRTN